MPEEPEGSRILNLLIAVDDFIVYGKSNNINDPYYIGLIVARDRVLGNMKREEVVNFLRRANMEKIKKRRESGGAQKGA